LPARMGRQLFSFCRHVYNFQFCSQIRPGSQFKMLLCHNFGKLKSCRKSRKLTRPSSRHRQPSSGHLHKMKRQRSGIPQRRQVPPVPLRVPSALFHCIFVGKVYFDPVSRLPVSGHWLLPRVSPSRMQGIW